jgi:Flp pilus assembly protein TadD
MKRVAAPLALLVALASARTSLAQTSATDKAAVRALFDEGKRLMDAGQFAQACPKFADSEKLDPDVGTLLDLGVCYEKNGQTASAWATYKEAASAAANAGEAAREKYARH